MMEVFAGFISHADYHYGRLFAFLKEIREWENTLIMFISDNGASAEGGPTGSVNENLFFNSVPESLEDNLKALPELGGPKYYNHYPWGWTWAGNTPFRRWKRETYRGGISDPFIVHWPKGIKAKGEIRTQYAHAIDMVPTVLELLGIEPPTKIRGVTQSPIEGLSFAHALDNAKAPTHHITQYFEMLGHRSIYHDGWRAVCPWPGPSFIEAGKPVGEPIPAATLTELDAKHWELYHVAEDFAENRNVAAEHRDKLIEMVTQWYVEAGRYNVLPVDGRVMLRAMEERPRIAVDRKSTTYYPGTQVVPLPGSTYNRPHSFTADVEIPAAGAEGVLLSMGGVDGGYAFYVKDGKLCYVHNYVGKEIMIARSKDSVPAGRHELRFEFEPTGAPDIRKGKGSPGRAQLYIDRKLVGQLEMAVTTPVSYGIGAGLSVGADVGSPITSDYKAPFRFTGKLYTVKVDVSGELILDDELTMRRIMARQ
jgi:arylsulfatase